jgi:anti-anti-sigma factor
MSEVEFVASLGMGMLVQNAKALQRNHVRMVLADPPQLVEDALRQAGIDSVLPIGHGAAEVEALLAA